MTLVNRLHCQSYRDALCIFFSIFGTGGSNLWYNEGKPFLKPVMNSNRIGFVQLAELASAPKSEILGNGGLCGRNGKQ